MASGPDESDALRRTYVEALEADVGDLIQVTNKLGHGPVAFLGSGGNVAVAELASRLHEEVYRSPAVARTTGFLADMPFIDKQGLALFTSSAKHSDAINSIKALGRSTLGPTAVVTHRRAGDIYRLAGPDIEVVSLPPLHRPDGFIATYSVLQSAVMLMRAYLDHTGFLASIELDVDDEFRFRSEILILTPPSLMAVAIDFETRFVETGLAAVQIADYRNFAHGRHTGLSRRMAQTTILALSDRESRTLSDSTIGELPTNADVQRWHSEGSWSTTIIELLGRSMITAIETGRAQGINVSRPGVPAFGRRLYNLPVERLLNSQRMIGGVERKLLASGVRQELGVGQVQHEAEEWSSRLADSVFTGLVLDYDGTLVWTRQRTAQPANEIQRYVVALIDKGVGLGIASGRGPSLHDSLRSWIPARQWDRVWVGLYNGGDLVTLKQEAMARRYSSVWSRSVVSALSELKLADTMRVEQRTGQVSLRFERIVTSPDRFIRRIDQHLVDHGIDGRTVVSGHGVDIVSSSVSKVSVVAAIVETFGGDVLTIGDQGQVGGNDYDLLAHSPGSLSVNRCSGDMTRCWFAGDGSRTGPDLLQQYFNRLHCSANEFAIRGMVVR